MTQAKIFKIWVDEQPCDPETGHMEMGADEFFRALIESHAVFKTCWCGSSYCHVCGGSHDHNLTPEWLDGSHATVQNPHQSAFPRRVLYFGEQS